MDREEPRFNPKDIGEVEFRSQRQRVEPTARPAARDDGLVWKIAVGVVLGLIVFFGLQRCVDEYRARQAIAAMSAELAKLEAAAQGQQELQQRRARERAASRQHAEDALLLRAGERCINGKRFRRLSNGWEELPRQPCK